MWPPQLNNHGVINPRSTLLPKYAPPFFFQQTKVTQKNLGCMYPPLGMPVANENFISPILQGGPSSPIVINGVTWAPYKGSLIHGSVGLWLTLLLGAPSNQERSAKTDHLGAENIHILDRWRLNPALVTVNPLFFSTLRIQAPPDRIGFLLGSNPIRKRIGM